MIIDTHAHLFHPRWYPEAFRRWLVEDAWGRRPAGAPRSRRYEDTLVRMLTDDEGHRTVHAMDTAGIDRRVVLILDWGLELGEAECTIREVHEEILAVCARFPDRLIGFAGLDPRRPDAIDTLVWAMDDLGACGLKLHPTSAGWKLTDDRTKRLVEVVAARQLPVLVHVGPTLSILTGENASFEGLVALATDFPTAQFIAGHAGGSLWRALVGKEGIPANLYFDISGWQSRMPEPGALALDLDGLARAFPGRVLFGTDSPFFSYGAASEKAWVDRLGRCLVDQGHDPEPFFGNPILRRLTREAGGTASS